MPLPQQGLRLGTAKHAPYKSLGRPCLCVCDRERFSVYVCVRVRVCVQGLSASVWVFACAMVSFWDGKISMCVLSGGVCRRVHRGLFRLDDLVLLPVFSQRVNVAARQKVPSLHYTIDILLLRASC